MAVRTKQLAAGTQVAGAGVSSVYTAPAGETVILKDVRIWAFAGAVTRCLFTVRSGVATALIDRALTSNEVVAIPGFIVLQAGDQLEALATGNDFRFWASGAELEGVAD